MAEKVARALNQLDADEFSLFPESDRQSLVSLCLGGRSHEAYSSSSVCHSFIHSFIHSVRRQNSASADN